MSDFQNYVVRFSDGRIKIGMTSNLRKRMAYYRQEANRSGISHITWWAAAAFAEKRACLLMERLLCNSYKHLAIKGCREWLGGDTKVFSEVIQQSEFVRRAFSATADGCGESFGYWSSTGPARMPS